MTRFNLSAPSKTQRYKQNKERAFTSSVISTEAERRNPKAPCAFLVGISRLRAKPSARNDALIAGVKRHSKRDVYIRLKLSGALINYFGLRLVGYALAGDDNLLYILFGGELVHYRGHKAFDNSSKSSCTRL